MSSTDPLLCLPAFCGTSRDEARLLLRHTDQVALPAGQSVLLDTGPAAELLVVITGRLLALGPGAGWTAGPGDVLGAHALLRRTPQPHAFRVVEPSRVAYASPQQTRALMSASPAFAAAVAASLAAELDRRDAVAAATG